MTILKLLECVHHRELAGYYFCAKWNFNQAILGGVNIKGKSGT